MMDKLWVVLLVALTGAHLGHGLPVRSTPHSYPRYTNDPILQGWKEGNLYAAVPVLALIATAVGFLIGCTWCYRHKDCKQNEGADNQLFTASATHLHERRSHPPDSGFSEPANNNISEDNNNGPISLREMQNIANNNAAAYIVSENEERNRVSRESVVEFEPLPTGIRVADPLERCVDWFGNEDFPRNRLQYLREIGRGWFGRVVEGEIEDEGTTTPVAVKILNQNASLEDKARFLDEARLYRDARHENVLAFVASCLQEDPWILIFELCSTDLQTYLTANRPKMAALDESGVPLRLMCDVTAALVYLHSRGHAYGYISASNVLVRGAEADARAVLGHYGLEPEARPQPDRAAPAHHTASNDVQCLGTLIWEICAWGAPAPPAPRPELVCPYQEHLYQVMQLCWNANPRDRPTAAQVHALLNHLYTTHARSQEASRDDGYGSSDFEDRWQRLKPNTIPKLDEHVAIVHAPSTSVASHFTGSEEFDLPTVQDSLSVDMDTAVSRSSSIMSDKELSIQIKSESLTNLHGSLEDVRNIYLTHNETPVLDCQQANLRLEDSKDRENDPSDSSVDPWLKDIIAGSQDDVSYYRDVSDVIKNLDNILNSEKTSSSESSHQASPSRDNLSLDCKKDYPMQSSMVKSPGISNFQNILDIGFDEKSPEKKRNEDEDRDTIGTLSHSFERHSDTISQATLENLTPDTPIQDMELPLEERINDDFEDNLEIIGKAEINVDAELPKENKIDNSDSVLPNLTDLFIVPSVNEDKCVLNVSEDCQSPGDNNLADIVIDKETVEAKSISETENAIKSESFEKVMAKNLCSFENSVPVNVQNKEVFVEISHKVESDKTKVLLPSATVYVNDTKDLRLEPSRTNSQNEINNDLITPAESTTDSKIAQVETVSLEVETSASKANHLVNVSEISIQTTDRTEETKLGELPLPIFEIRDASPLPEVVEPLFIDANKDDIQNNFEVIPVPVSDSEFPVSKNIDEEFLSFLAKEEKTQNQNNFITSTLNLPESQNEIKPFDKVSEEFVANIIKEAETAALSSTETAHTKIVALKPINDSRTKESITAFLESEIVFLESDPINKVVIVAEVQPKKLSQLNASRDNKLGTFLKEELKEISNEVPELTNLDDIADKILIENIQDVPKASEKVDPSQFFLDDNITDLRIEIPTIYLENITAEPVPEIVQVSKPKKQQILPKQDEVELFDQGILTSQSVLPQTSIEIESTASADSSQSTFLIQDIVKEECKSHSNEDRKHSLHEDSRHNATIPVEPISNALLEGDCRLMELSKETRNNAQQQNISNEVDKVIPNVAEVIVGNHCIEEQNAVLRPKNVVETVITDKSDNSTAYMDLSDGGNDVILETNLMDENVKDVINSCLLKTCATESFSSPVMNGSTVYLNLPNVTESNDVLHSEKQLYNDVYSKDPLSSSTPKSLADDSQVAEQDKSDELSVTKVPDYGPGVTLTKLEQQCVPDSMSPFESPTKSHPTDTYDENSSVVLGPFENCTMELFKGVKSATDPIDVPKEELLAFSSNFSEMDLETPSPLRDGNFLNEVPDIVHDDLHFDDIISEPKDLTDPKTDVSDATDQSVTERRVSPSTPPNSPGYFLASTSQQKYVVEIDLNPPTEPAPVELDSGLSSLHKEIELNQIELQITSKLAMAENENNLNIEYSGPLTVEGLVQDDLQMEEESVPEKFLAGNGGCIEDIRERFTLDEACVNALRNELELKLPLAQVAAIEPQCESEWSPELPPPPELIVSYPGALSPIAEETGPQLSAYENDAQWTASTSVRTDSSESYPEPCDSTDEATELPAHTYTLPSRRDAHAHGHTPQRDVASSREITMSADSLNGSPRKSNAIDDRTFTVDEEKDACSRLSQVSPFVLSPTADSSAPEESDVTGVSTLSKTTVPTDAKITKPSETQCLSKATSIDSWCSNDTLYNVEEAFDDLASDPELPLDFDIEKELDNSESSNTLTLEKDPSRVSTYIVHDSPSDEDRFSPDSITANDNANYTYTKVKTELDTSPSVLTKSEVHDSKTQTKDLAYGTLMSGVPSYSNCTTEMMSADNGWILPHPELVRRSPIDGEADITAVVKPDCQEIVPEDSPQLKDEPRIKKMDSVDISCLEDHLLDSSPRDRGIERAGSDGSPDYNYDMTGTATSTPLTEAPLDDNVEPIMLTLPVEVRTPVNLPSNIPNFQSFLLSAELRPQNRSYNRAEGSRSALAGDCTRISSDTTPSYTDFENAATFKPQETPRTQSSQNSSDKFHQFEDSVRERPQDLATDASALLLISERDFALNENLRPSQLSSQHEPTSLIVSPPSITTIRESQVSNTYIVTDLKEDETEQPHSIIIATVPKEGSNQMYNLHPSRMQKDDANKETNAYDSFKELAINGLDDQTCDLENVEPRSLEIKSGGETKEEQKLVVNNTNTFNAEYRNEPSSLIISPSISSLQESHVGNTYIITDLEEDETEQPHSIIIAEVPKESPSRTYDSHTFGELNNTYDSHPSRRRKDDAVKESNSDNSKELTVNGLDEQTCDFENFEAQSPKVKSVGEADQQTSVINNTQTRDDIPNGSVSNLVHMNNIFDIKCNGNSEKFATVNFINESFEELLESNVDDGDCKDKTDYDYLENSKETEILPLKENKTPAEHPEVCSKSSVNGLEEKMVAVTEDFLQNEKTFCQFDSYLPLLSDIRFTGPASEIMSTSFTQESPTEPENPERDEKPGTDMKEWDSDTDSHSSNSSSGEFIWKGGNGQETSVVPSTHFDHRGSNGGSQPPGERSAPGASSGESGSGSGSEGDEVEFVPSSWDCRAEPAKSSLRSLREASQDNKKRVVFKRQKYHCVYEYPRELAAVDADSPAYLPDLSTYTEWDTTSAEEAELGYGQLFGAPAPLDLYPLRGTVAFGTDYDEDFFISSSARPFESLGVMSTTSQFFPGMQLKPGLVELPDDLVEEFPPPPSPLVAPAPALAQTRTPSLDFTTPDSGVEDITPGSTSTDEDYKVKKLPESEVSQWRSIDSGSSSESVSPSSPGGEALGGLRHTRDKLKLDLPPSPHIPSPRHGRVFNFVLDKPKRPRVPDEKPAETGSTPLVMTDETPVVSTSLPLPKDCEDVPLPEPTFSTFGKCTAKVDAEQKIILTDDVQERAGEVKPASPVKVEAVKGEGTVLDSGDEDSGIESSSKATLERNKTPNVS